MNEKQTHFDWRFGLQWLVTCAIGTAIGGAVAFFTMWSAGEAAADVIGDIAGGFVAGGLFGGLLGLGANAGPAFLLQQRGMSGARWFVASAVAAALSAGIAIATASNMLDTMPGAAIVIFIGLVLGGPMGIVQWLILRQHDVAANAWPIISVVAYLLAAVVIGSGNEYTALPLMMAGIGLLVGAVTGLGAAWLLRRQTAVAI